MKIYKGPNLNFKWYNPLTWHKVTYVNLTNDILISPLVDIKTDVFDATDCTLLLGDFPENMKKEIITKLQKYLDKVTNKSIAKLMRDSQVG